MIAPVSNGEQAAGVVPVSVDKKGVPVSVEHLADDDIIECVLNSNSLWIQPHFNVI